MPKKKWTKRRVTRDTIILLVVLSAAVLTPVAYVASQARRDISERFILDASNQAVSQFLAMSGSVETTLRIVRDWGATETISLEKTDELPRTLSSLFVSEKLLHGISIADTAGNSFYMRVHGNGYRSSIVSGQGEDRYSNTTLWTEDVEAAESYKTNSIYDTVRRPWFLPALSTEGVVWTEPYSFYTSKAMGMTASTSFTRKKDGEPVVIAFDILLDDLFGQAREFAPSDNSRVFIFRRDAKLYIPETEDMPSEFVPVGDAGNDLIQKVHANWFGDQQLMDKIVSVFHDGQVWWCGFRPLDTENRTTWICVMVPESDTLPHAGRRSKRLWLIAISSVLAASGLAFWMIRRYGRASAATEAFDREDSVGSVRRIIAGGENRYVEFKSTMRMNLHSKKPGKEIELAWMKGVAGFLNTDGGILLIGVTDDGEITGLERDVFENEDKCRLHFKNLISKHIGADHSKYIRFIIVPIDGLTVGVVRCERSSDPVFMKDANKEHFYIRNGPSSDELPVSQALNYIKHREK